MRTTATPSPPLYYSPWRTSHTECKPVPNDVHLSVSVLYSFFICLYTCLSVVVTLVFFLFCHRSAHLPHSDSKPFIAILERSSQLVEDTFTEETPRIIIDATPPAGRRGRRAKKPKKRSIEEVARAESSMTPDTKRVKYQLRSRKRQQLAPEVECTQHTVHTYSTHSTYTQYIHTVHTYSTYIQYIHTVHTYSTYTQYIHTVHTYSTYSGSVYMQCPKLAKREGGFIAESSIISG